MSPDSLPAFKSSVPEIAFIGRSNVGKSSLLNSIVKDISPVSEREAPVRNCIDMN